MIALHMHTPVCDLCFQPILRREMRDTTVPCNGVDCQGFAHVSCLARHFQIHPVFTCLCGRQVRRDPNGRTQLVVAPALSLGRWLLHMWGLTIILGMAWLVCFVLWIAMRMETEGGIHETSMPFGTWYGSVAVRLFVMGLFSLLMTGSFNVFLEIYYRTPCCGGRGEIPFD